MMSFNTKRKKKVISNYFFLGHFISTASRKIFSHVVDDIMTFIKYFGYKHGILETSGVVICILTQFVKSWLCKVSGASYNDIWKFLMDFYYPEEIILCVSSILGRYACQMRQIQNWKCINMYSFSPCDTFWDIL